MGVALGTGAHAFRFVEGGGEQIGRRDTIGKGVVDLGDDGQSAVCQAVDHVDLPQRPGPVQRFLDQPGDGVVEFAAPARGRQVQWSHVVFEVDRAVLPPHRAMEAVGRVDEHAPQRFESVQALLHHLAGRFHREITGARCIEYGHLDGVHRHVGGLAEQHHRVRTGKSFHTLTLRRRSSGPAIAAVDARAGATPKNCSCPVASAEWGRTARHVSESGLGYDKK